MLRFVLHADFNDPQRAYPQELIINAFKILCKKVNVFNESSQTYWLGKSIILTKEFDKCEKQHQLIGQNDVWQQILAEKCTAVPS